MPQIAPTSPQQTFWNRSNQTRQDSIGEVLRRQAEVVCGWLRALGRKDLDILDLGCGAGWFGSQLTRFGRVTGTDRSDEVLTRAQIRAPEPRVVPGDFMQQDLGRDCCDVVVTLQVLAPVADQRALVRKLASHPRPSGHPMLATQKRFVLKYLDSIPRPAPGQLRRWVDRQGLRHLPAPDFAILELLSVTPKVGRGLGIRPWLRSRGLAWGGATAAGARRGELPTRTAEPGLGSRARRWLAARLEAAGLGWAQMALARRPIAA